MAWPVSLQVGLKEWAVVCAALEGGRQMVLLRKGGIYEAAGEFELEHREFLLFPTYLHQKREMLKLEAQQGVEEGAGEPEEVHFTGAGVVTDIVQLKSRRQMDALEGEHIWAPELIDMRFNYRPENPLYLMLVRCYRLHEPEVIANTPAYAGCKSWVPLGAEVATGTALPVLDDLKYEIRKAEIMNRLGK
ncbi:MAG TPA: DUF1802 family protein [Tepidisphaeraceae bacterium]|jgi:hypothetical protein